MQRPEKQPHARTLFERAEVPSLEKVTAAARRMAVSPSQVYREVKAGHLLLVKTGPRASALVSSSVDAWIAARIAEASQRVAA